METKMTLFDQENNGDQKDDDDDNQDHDDGDYRYQEQADHH